MTLSTPPPAQASQPAAPLAIISPDDAEWEAFRHSARGHLLQEQAWGALKERFGWRARRVAVMGTAGIVAGAQLLLRQRFGVAAAYVPRGPIFGPDPAANELLLHALVRLARRARAVFLRIEPNLLDDDPRAEGLRAALELAGWREAPPIQPRSSIHLSLAPNPEALFAGFSKGHRADIRRAARQGLAVRAGGAGDLSAFFGQMRATSARKDDYGLHSQGYYEAAFELFGDDALLLLAEHEGATVGACMVFSGGDEALYLYGGSDERGLKLGANHALQQRAIEWARARGCARYDFWGVPDGLALADGLPPGPERAAAEQAAAGDPLHGVFRFKKGFGGGVVRYLPAFDRVFIPPLYRLWLRRMG
jgi:lipid II:glycine glycyltransferase (peptidoglycan interpeptide bridge formation enzyme)